LRNRLDIVEKRKYLRKKLSGEPYTSAEDELIFLQPQVEAVSLRKRTMADIKKEKLTQKAPQLEKDIADFKFKNLSHDN
jgi:hypothetical protein